MVGFYLTCYGTRTKSAVDYEDSPLFSLLLLAASAFILNLATKARCRNVGSRNEASMPGYKRTRNNTKDTHSLLSDIALYALTVELSKVFSNKSCKVFVRVTHLLWFRCERLYLRICSREMSYGFRFCCSHKLSLLIFSKFSFVR